jgi:hypothetical protein
MTKVYEVQIDSEEKPTYAGTMADAKGVIKAATEAGAVYMPDVRVTECEVQSDKEGLVFALIAACPPGTGVSSVSCTNHGVYEGQQGATPSTSHKRS